MSSTRRERSFHARLARFLVSLPAPKYEEKESTSFAKASFSEAKNSESDL